MERKTRPEWEEIDKKIQQLQGEKSFNVTEACRALGINKAGYYSYKSALRKEAKGLSRQNKATNKIPYFQTFSTVSTKVELKLGNFTFLIPLEILPEVITVLRKVEIA